MSERYAELRLYFGLVDSDGCSEGFFAKELNDEYTRRRFFRAIDTVRKCLQPGWESAFQLGYEHFVQSDKEAQELTAYAEKNIRGAKGVIELESCFHGKITFFKKIRFDDWVKEQKRELIEQLKKSGYQPKDEEREDLKLRFKNFSYEYLNEKLEKLDSDQPWKKALKFY